MAERCGNARHRAPDRRRRRMNPLDLKTLLKRFDVKGVTMRKLALLLLFTAGCTFHSTHSTEVACSPGRSRSSARPACSGRIPRRHVHLSGLRTDWNATRRAAKPGDGPHRPEGPSRRERRRGVQDPNDGNDIAVDVTVPGASDTAKTPWILDTSRIHREVKGETGAPRLPQHRAGRAEHDGQRGFYVSEKRFLKRRRPARSGQGPGTGGVIVERVILGRAPLPSPTTRTVIHDKELLAEQTAERHGERGPCRPIGGACGI